MRLWKRLVVMIVLVLIMGCGGSDIKHHDVRVWKKELKKFRKEIIEDVEKMKERREIVENGNTYYSHDRRDQLEEYCRQGVQNIDFL